ncbi:uncharacterized protein PG986_014112 [Apiospora aurea]|uniref:Uncharacterized protein n=1 Tax=Apiospora aurea TaxID=335848 RepID=A0ABR1PS23_9PEZI
MRSIATLLFIALCVVMAHAGAGECSGDKHQDGDVFCGNNKISFQCSAGKLSVKETCTGTKVCQDERRIDEIGSRFGATCG